MATPLALYNLKHGQWRTVVSTSGVAVAIVLVFMQLGFLNAVRDSATLIYDHLDFDVLLRSPDYFHFVDPREFPRAYLHYVESLPEVASVKPFCATLATWRIPKNEFTEQNEIAGQLRGILALGMDPTQNVFSQEKLPNIEDYRHLLQSPDQLLIDTKTKGSDYGALDGQAFGQEDRGQEVEVWDTRFQIAGFFELGAGMAANGSVLIGTEGYGRFFPSDPAKYVNFGLIELRDGVDATLFARQLKARLARETAQLKQTDRTETPVEVLTRDEARHYEIDRWIERTPIGLIFRSGVIVAFLVGAVVVYMVLSNDVANHLSEYATLKAMGYTDRYLSGVVMQQAVAMAVLGFVAAWIVASRTWGSTWTAWLPTWVPTPGWKGRSETRSRGPTGFWRG